MRTLSILLLIALPAGLIGGFKNLPKAIDKAEAPTVLIKITDEEGEQFAIGSGVSIIRGKSCYVWTDAHVVDIKAPHTLYVHKKIIKDGEEVSSVEVEAEIVKINTDIDVALLKLKDKVDKSHFKNARFYLEDKFLPRGTDVVLVGNFLKFKFTTPGFTGAAPGVIGGFKHVTHDNGQELDIIHNGAVVNGCSGSGVWIEDGRCIGLVCRMYTTNEVLYNPIRVMKKWAKEENIMWALDEKLKAPVDK